MNRDHLIASLKAEQTWDVIVIGGGASGLGAAVEAATRGYKTLLLEQYDFTIGTSSRSTKLVHGGVRYLAQGDIMLVLEALRERGFLLKNAPHLVKNQVFLIPSYNWWAKPFYTIGLSVYNLLSGKLSFGPSLPFSRKKAIAKMPGLVTEKLRGGVIYHDGQFDDSRLGLNLAHTLIEHGGLALNYFKVDDVIKENGKINGVKATDLETGTAYTINARSVVNATGVFTDDIMLKDSPESEVLVKPSQGVHIVIDQDFLQSDYAVMIPKTNDGRVLFAVPWYNRVILGTTDIPKPNASIEPKATEEEIDFILETASRFLARKPTRADIKCVFAGLRPLAAPKKADGKTKEISRKHKIIVSDSGLVSVIGGKWTIYREMGEDVINTCAKTAGLPERKSITRSLKLHGYKAVKNEVNTLDQYGSDMDEIKKIIDAKPETAEWLSEDLKVNKAMVIWAVREEFARKVEDVLSRRTRSLILDVKESQRIAPMVAEIMAEELGYDQKWKDEQVGQYNELAANYLVNV